MNRLIDKVIVFLLCSSFYLTEEQPIYAVVPVLIAVILSAALSYLDQERVTLAVFASYLLLCLWFPFLIYFLPLFAYDAAGLARRWVWLFAFLPLLTPSTETFFLSSGWTAVLILAVWLLRHRTSALEHLEVEHWRLRDDAKRFAMQLEQQNQTLVEKQDHEVTLATLRERNRIARDIHDNVGHLLTRSILQVGALLAMHKDPAGKESLGQVKTTLSEAMDTIRVSVHDLHEESVDLRTEMQKLVDSFSFCPLTFEYEVESGIDKKIKYSLIAITKEALANIIKHSGASEAALRFREHPALYQLVIWDNGTGGKREHFDRNGDYHAGEGGGGIGMQSICDRVSSLGGHLHIRTDRGFRIFISIPKQQAS